MKYARKDIAAVIETLISSRSYVVTKYLDSKHVIRATRIRYDGGLHPDGEVDIRLKLGSPNYLEREFIKTCRRAGEPFPVKKVQLKDFPKKRRA